MSASGGRAGGNPHQLVTKPTSEERTSVPDICDLILDDHEIFRRRFAELDDERRSDVAVVCALWAPLAEHLERHANAEEDLFYPALLRRGADAEEETDDAIRDHNKIRDAVRRA